MAEREQKQNNGPSMLGGWQQAEGEPRGTYTAKTQQVGTTEEFSRFAEASRARWDLVEYLKVKFHHMLHKKV
jgi:hypothetical protein